MKQAIKEKINEVRKKIKSNAKKIALFGMLLGATLSGNSATAKQQENTPKKTSTELKTSENEPENDVPAFFGEKPFKLDKEQAWKMVEKAELNEEQIEQFIKNIGILSKSPQGITDKNFYWIMQKSVQDKVFSQQQGDVINMMMLEKTQKEKMPSGEILIEDELEHTSNHESGEFSYQFIDGKLKVNNNGVVEVNSLMPNLYQLKDGSYKCGSTTGNNRGLVLKNERMKLSMIAVNEKVYADLQKRQSQGEILGKVENKFMQEHMNQLESHGLFHDKKGNLQQKDRVEQIRNMQKTR